MAKSIRLPLTEFDNQYDFGSQSTGFGHDTMACFIAICFVNFKCERTKNVQVQEAQRRHRVENIRMAPLFQALQSSTQPCPTRHECGQTLTIDGEFIAVLSVVYPALLLQWRVADACNLLHSYCVAHCLMSHAWGKSKCFRVKYYPVCDSSF